MTEINIPLAIADYGEEEINECLDSLRSTFVTMGKKVHQFEEMWAKEVGMARMVAVNSGSSANLLAIAMWIEMGWLRPGDEIIVPATTWSTSIWPLLQYGLIPIFADIDEFFTLDPESVKKAITKRTRAVMIVPLLGNVFDPRLLDIAKEHQLLVMVDACEAHGATLEDRDLGSYGDVATWSFFLSHHITTIEGGMVGVHSPYEADILRSLRAHGWIRERENKDEALGYVSPDGVFDSRFLFFTVGYNLRPTELTGAFGIHQIPKLKDKVEHRTQIAKKWSKTLDCLEIRKWIQIPRSRSIGKSSWFGYPIVLNADAPFDRSSLIQYLSANRIDTRPIMAGDIRQHPALKRTTPTYRFSSVVTPRTDEIFQRGFFVGLHRGIGQKELEHFINVMDSFGEEYTKRSFG